MTPKRFTFDKYSNLYDNELDACYGIANSKEAETLCDMLNMLHDENEQLKKELDCFKPLIFETDGMPITLYEKKDDGDVE